MLVAYQPLRSGGMERSIVGASAHYFRACIASLHVGRGIDMGSRHDDFLM